MYEATQPMSPADEAAHETGKGELWSESWYMDFAATDCRLGGYVRLGVYPHLGVAWLWLVLVGGGLPDASQVRIVNHAFALPALPDLTVADATTWCQLRCIEPYRLWSVRAEGLVPPDVPFSIELECSAAAPVYRYAATMRYEQSSHVIGTVSVGERRLTVDAPGQRDHSWGVRDWWRIPWLWTAGCLDDGTRLHVVQLLLPRSIPPIGYVVAGSTGCMVEPVRCRVLGPPSRDGTPAPHTRLVLDDLDVRITPLVAAPVSLRGPSGQAGTLLRSLSSMTTSDGRTGSGWLEWNLPTGRTLTGGAAEADSAV